MIKLYSQSHCPKASVQFSSEDVTFLTTNLPAPLNIPSQFPQRQSFQTRQWSVSVNSLKRMHTSESSFLKRFLLGFISGYFIFFAIVFNVMQNITFSVLQEQCSNTVSWEKRHKSLSGIHISQSSFSESFSPVFIWRYVLFPHRPECDRECPFANPSKTQFQNHVIESFMYERGIDISITKQLQKNLVSTFCLRIFPFSP